MTGVRGLLVAVVFLLGGCLDASDGPHFCAVTLRAVDDPGEPRVTYEEVHAEAPSIETMLESGDDSQGRPCDESTRLGRFIESKTGSWLGTVYFPFQGGTYSVRAA
jgi:hypothetical protein